jgi:hypothetical protein
VIDGRSFAERLRGRPGPAREWVFIQLARMWYVRDKDWKLNQAGQLFDMTRAPFEEPIVTTETPAATAARNRLQKALDKLNPGGGILDDGDGTGRHANREANRKQLK